MDDQNTLWSKTIPEKSVHEVETRFSIIFDNEKKSDDMKLKWFDADNLYSSYKI
jgi:hypothetical protein